MDHVLHLQTTDERARACPWCRRQWPPSTAPSCRPWPPSTSPSPSTRGPTRSPTPRRFPTTSCTVPTTPTRRSASGGPWCRRTGHALLPGPVPRQVQPGAPLLGRPRSGRHPVLGTAGAAPSRRRAELPRSCAAAGLQPRGAQLRLLARPGARRARSTPTPTRNPTASPSGPSRPTRPTTTRLPAKFILPYAAVRTAADPDATLLSFFQSSVRGRGGPGPLGPGRARSRWAAPAIGHRQEDHSAVEPRQPIPAKKIPAGRSRQ